MSDAASIGHNRAPIPTPDEIVAQLEAQLADRIARRDELLAMEAVAVENDSDEADTLEAIKILGTYLKDVESARVAEKDPYLRAERAIDGFFQKQLAADATKLRDAMTGHVTAYQRARADAERRRREQLAREEEARRREAQRIAREAEREAAAAQRAVAAAAARAAKAQADEAAMAAAERAATQARDAASKASTARAEAAAAATRSDTARDATRVSDAELSRTRTDLGVVGSLRTTWVHEVVEPAAVPREFCKPDDGLIHAVIRAGTTKDGRCNVKIAGVRIYPRSTTQAR